MARNSGAPQTVKRILSALPHNPQSFIDSPYLDHALYVYDDKMVNNYDRGRPCWEFPVKFWCRRTGKVKFKLDPNPVPYGEMPLLKGIK
ncbi:acid phosphatase det1 [Blyttiomyces sp. JEL0837]|nr:acid phosphatase det1 [Blyttiomyces sp. JEL0837]